MKKLFNLIAVPASLVIFVTITHFAFAVQKKEARVTQVMKDVRLIPSDSSPRPASINDYVSTGTASGPALIHGPNLPLPIKP